MTPRRDLVADILDLVTLIAKDDARTRATLALLRNGHPQAAKFNHGQKRESSWLDEGYIDHTNDRPPHSDPTGEMALRPDDGERRLRDYRFHMKRAYQHVEQLDRIRRSAAADTNEAKNQADPDDWCRNCLPHGFCSPKSGGAGHHYCKWCRTVRQEWGFLPPGKAVQAHHDGDRMKVSMVLREHKKAKKR